MSDKAITINYLNNELNKKLESMNGALKCLEIRGFAEIKYPYNMHALIVNSALDALKIYDTIEFLAYTDKKFKDLKCFEWRFRTGLETKITAHKLLAKKCKETK